jgi:cadmium resistance protein CadD (predicted permease)
MVAVLVASVLAFAATNVDDFFALLLLYAAGGRPRVVVLGQCLGFAAIVLASFAVSVGAMVVPTTWVGFFGAVPFGLGVRNLLRRRAAPAEDSAPPLRVSIPAVASITVANGGDNIGVYAPFFARRPPHELTTILGVFAALVVVWCLVALGVARLPLVARALDRWGHRCAPWILMGLGVYVFVKAQTWSVLWH